jgi:hypothetical protein
MPGWFLLMPDQTILRGRFADVSRRLSESQAQPYTAKSAFLRECSRQLGDRMTVNRNILYLIVGVLVVVICVLGYNLYQAKREPQGLQINVGPNGLKIENK